jgi:hypothetical protein
MRSSDLRREENYNEYLRLLQNDDYVDVTYDEQSGGMSAVHKLHKFAKQQGAYGMPQGDYERVVQKVMRKEGYRIVLEAETNTPGVKSCDGFLDDLPMEIKAIEGNGTWTISSKLLKAEKQHAQCCILYFPDEMNYSEFRVSEGIRLSQTNPAAVGEPGLMTLLVIVENQLVARWHKKATPIEGWSIGEGLRR